MVESGEMGTGGEIRIEAKRWRWTHIHIEAQTWKDADKRRERRREAGEVRIDGARETARDPCGREMYHKSISVGERWRKR